MTWLWYPNLFLNLLRICTQLLYSRFNRLLSNSLTINKTKTHYISIYPRYVQNLINNQFLDTIKSSLLFSTSAANIGVIFDKTWIFLALLTTRLTQHVIKLNNSRNSMFYQFSLKTLIKTSVIDSEIL